MAPLRRCRCRSPNDKRSHWPSPVKGSLGASYADEHRLSRRAGFAPLCDAPFALFLDPVLALGHRLAQGFEVRPDSRSDRAADSLELAGAARQRGDGVGPRRLGPVRAGRRLRDRFVAAEDLVAVLELGQRVAEPTTVAIGVVGRDARPCVLHLDTVIGRRFIDKARMRLQDTYLVTRHVADIDGVLLLI